MPRSSRRCGSRASGSTCAGHEGAHPRIGAADVVPVVPVVPEDLERAQACALELARRLGDELGAAGIPVRGVGARPRPCVLSARRARGAAAATRFGKPGAGFRTRRLHERAGGVIVGARRPLIAFNVNLRAASVETAREIAAWCARAAAGFLAFARSASTLPGAGVVQVSMNVEDWEAAALHEIVARVEAEAAARGAEVSGAELVGLMPAGAAVAAAGASLRIDGFDPSRVLELRLLDDARF